MKSSRRNLIFWIMLVSGVTIFLVAFYQYRIATAEQNPQFVGRTQVIAALEQQLGQKGLSSDAQASIKSKLEALYYQETLQAEGIRQLTAMPTEAEAARRSMAQPAITIQEKRMTGIISNPSVPFSTSEFLITNAWQDIVNGSYVTVYAGALAKDQAQGVLLISDEGRKTGYKLLSPTKSGSLIITAIQNGRLIINAGNKNQFTFDLSMMSFVDKSGKAIPPIPTTVFQITTQTPVPIYPPPN